MFKLVLPRALLCAALQTVAWGALAQTPALPATQTLTLPQALQEARANFDVAIARGGLEAARADILAADHAPLPVLSGKLSQIDLDKGTGSGPLYRRKIDKGIGIDFTWERGDKRALRTRAAQDAVGAAEADLNEVLAQQQLATQAAFYDLLAAQERVALTEALARDTLQLADSARKRERAGDLARQDATRIEIEAERVRADALGAVLDRQRAALALGQLTGRGAQAERLAVQGPWPTPENLALADVQSLAEARPDVRAAAARVRAAQAALDGARALRRNDVTWGVSYDHYPGTSRALVELRAQMPLQWGYAYEGEIGRAVAQLRQAEDLQDKTLRAALADLRRLQLEAGSTVDRARRFEQDIMPRAQQVAQSAEIAYQRGGLGLTDLLDARRTLRSTLADAVLTRAEAAKALGAWRVRTQGPSLDSSTGTAVSPLVESKP